jgi:hypothetical protein
VPHVPSNLSGHVVIVPSVDAAQSTVDQSPPCRAESASPPSESGRSGLATSCVKSRRRGQLQSDDQGQFMLIEAASNRIIMGERFDAKLADINA